MEREEECLADIVFRDDDGPKMVIVLFAEAVSGNAAVVLIFIQKFSTKWNEEEA